MNDENVEDLKDLIGFLSDRVSNIEKAVENHNVKEAMGQVTKKREQEATEKTEGRRDLPRKLEIRSTKLETNSKHEIQNPKKRNRKQQRKQREV